MGRPTRKEIQDELAELRLRLEEAEETLNAIRRGEVDALVVSGPEGEKVFTLKGADHSYRILVETISEGAATLTRDGKILYANRRLADLLQTPLQRVIGSFIFEYVVLEDRPWFEALLLQVRREDNRGEVRLRAANGAEVPSLLSVSPMPPEDFSDKLSLVVTDLSEQKRQEEILAAGRLSRAILEQAEQAIVVCDPKGIITQASRAAHRLYRGNPLLHPFEEAFPLRLQVEGSAADLSSGEAFSLSAILQGEIYQGVEATCKRQDGQELYVLLNAGPLYDEHGAVLGCVVSLTDITERMQAQGMLRRQAELLDLAYDAILVHDLVGRITYWNQGAAELYGWTRGEAMGKVVHRLLATEFPQPVESIETLVLEHVRWEGELIHTTRDGRRLMVDSRWSLKRDEAGRPLAILEINHDVTARRQAEQALRKSERRLRKLVEANIIGITVSDEENIVEANDAFLQMIGYTREELRGGEINWLELTPGEHLPQDAQALYELRTTGTHTPFEKAYVRKDGSRVSVVVGGALLEGDPLTWVSFTLDISERKQLEAASRESEARFRAIFTNASIGIATTDLKGHLQHFNAPVIRGLGYKPAELQGRSFLDITHPEDLEKDTALFTELAAGQRDQYQLEKRYLRKDGQVLWGRLNMSLVRTPTGEPDFTVALLEDITARKKAQAALEESEARYRSLVELSPDAILVHARGRIIFVNQAGCKLFGAGSPKEILGLHVLDLVHPDSRQIVKQRVTRGYAGERVDLRELKILRLDGQLTEVETAATPVTYHGQPAVQVVTRDITERKQAEREIRRLASFPELNPLPILEVDEKGQVIYANPATWRMVEKLGLSEEPTAFLPPDLKDIFAAVREGGPRQYFFDLALKDSFYAVVVFFPHDLPTAHLYAVDITERKRAEMALRESEEQAWARLAEIESIYSSAPVGLCVFDSHFRYVRINDRLAEINGFPVEEHIGRTPREIVPDLADMAEDIFERILKTGQPVRDLEFSGTTEAQPEVMRTWIEQWMPLKDSQGHVVGVSVAAEDITQRKQAEEALKQAHDELEQQVAERTADLKQTVEHLQKEIVRRQRIEAALKGSERKLRHLAEQLLTAQENERRRLAAELHDELGHALLTLKLALRAVAKKLLPTQENLKQEIQDQLDYINEVIEEVRRLYHDLSPGNVEELGLTEALHTLIEDFAGLQGQLTWEADLPDLDGLFSLLVQTIIYRTVQEALTNIGKHADPKHVTVTAVKEGSHVRFAVQDDGRGFDVDQVLNGHGAGRGVGLAAMEERLHMVDGSFAIQSREQEGTRLSFTIPILPEGERP
jgi:PAS domain S-box-containing protein